MATAELAEAREGLGHAVQHPDPPAFVAAHGQDCSITFTMPHTSVPACSWVGSMCLPKVDLHGVS